MSGKQAKAARRTDRLTEAIVQAHNRIHGDDIDGAHQVLHRALGTGSVEVTDSLAPMLPFDEAFRRLVVEHGVRASFVLADPVADNEVRLIAGGDAELCTFVRVALTALQPPTPTERTTA